MRGIQHFQFKACQSHCHTDRDADSDDNANGNANGDGDNAVRPMADVPP